MENKKIYVASNQVANSNKRKVSNGRVIVAYERVNNDMYGNPLYRIYPWNYSFKRIDSVYKNYESKGYYLIQSYNIESDLYSLMEKANQFVNEPLEKGLLEAQGYKEKVVL